MKRMVSALLALAVLAALVIVATTSKHGVRAVYAQSGCTNATLRGNYGLYFSGYSTPAQIGTGKGMQLLPFYGAGLLTFDGMGSVSGTITSAFDGNEAVEGPYKATYTVNPDCTVSAAGDVELSSDSFAGAIVSGGAEVLATDTTAPDTLNVDFKKQ